MIEGQTPVEIFCSYAYEDEMWLWKLETHLSLLKRQGLVSFWHDRLIAPGTDWAKAIDTHLETASVILLLVSADFFASDYCYGIEMKRALEREVAGEVHVIPILVRPADWTDAPFAHLQALPTDAKPIVSWRNKDTALADIVAGIRRVIVEELPQLTASAPRAALPKRRYVPFMVEDLPEGFVPRPDELQALIGLLLNEQREETVAVTAVLRGAGGYGKTTLARAICHDERVQKAFDDGILWVTLGEHPEDLLSKLEDLIYLLSQERPGFSSLDAAQTRFAELLADQDLLLVIDDVWNAAHLRPFLQGGTRCARLITTRDDSVLPRLSQRLQVDAMSPEQAVQVLVAGLESASAEEIRTLSQLAESVGAWPLLLTLVNSALRERVNRGQRLADAVLMIKKTLEKRGLTAFDARDPLERSQAVKATLQVSFDLLSADEHARYRELAIFPEDVDIPLATVQQLWSATAGLDELDTEEICGRLARISLLQRFDLATRTIRFHDVLRTYLRQSLGEQELAAQHAQFLDAYVCPQWGELPTEEPYLWDYLAEHLLGAGRVDELLANLQDGTYLTAKVYVRSAYAVEADLNRAIAAVGNDPTLLALRRNIGLVSHLLNRCRTSGEVAMLLHQVLSAQPQLFARAHALEQKLPRPCLISWHPFPRFHETPLLRTLSGHIEKVNRCAISPDGTRIVSASDDSTLKVWDAYLGTELLTLEGHITEVSGCAISPDGMWIVSASWDKTLKVWDARSGTELLTLAGHTGLVRGCAISPDGTWIISASEDKTLKVWDVRSGTELLTLAGHIFGVNGCAISPDGTWIISASSDSTLKVWDAHLGTERLTPAGHTDRVYECAISPDGTWIVSASEDNTLKVWDAHLGTERLTLAGHTEWVLGCAISPDGEWIVSFSEDNTLKVWEIQTGRCRATLMGDAAFHGVAFCPDGSHLVAVGAQGVFFLRLLL